MRNKTIVIITGAPATGKTVLSKNLAEVLKVPVINKDEIKEILLDCFPEKDEEFRRRLGVPSFEIIYMFTEKLCLTEASFIVEGNFQSEYASDRFKNIAEKHNYKVIQVYCYSEVKTLYERYTKRNLSGERHPGHIININSIDDFKTTIFNRNFKLEIRDTVDIYIDTTDFSKVNIEDICENIINLL